MKIIKLTPAILLLSLVSCSKNNEISSPNVESEHFTIIASSEGSSSRLALSGDNFTEVVWQENDAINFFPCELTEGKITSKVPGDATLQQGTKLITSDSGNSVEFATEDGSEIPSTTTVGTETVDANTFLAITPYLDNEGTASSKIKPTNVDSSTRGTFAFTMPTTQSYVENSIDPTVAFAFAKSTDIDELKFANQFGVLRVNLVGSDIQKVTSIKVTSVSASGYLAGTINACTAEEYESGCKLAASGTKSSFITMDCGEGVALSEETTAFNIVLIPFTGVTVEITYEENGEVKTLEKTTNSVIERSSLTNMPTLDITPVGGGDTDNGGSSTEDLDETTGTWEE